MRRKYWELTNAEIDERGAELFQDHVESEGLLEAYYCERITDKAFRSRLEYLRNLSRQDAIDSLCEEEPDAEESEDEHEAGVPA